MGNLDDPELSPSPNYVATHEYVVETINGEDKKVEFNGHWLDYEMYLLLRTFSLKGFKISPLLYGKLDIFRLNAKGEAVGEDEYNEIVIPFQAKVSQNNILSGLGIIGAKEFGNSTIAFMLNVKKFSESQPDGYLNYSLSDGEHNLNLFTWGWSTTSSCSHIFNIPTNIDSFPQDEFSDTDYLKIDFVIGINSRNHKGAIRIRRISGEEKFFHYNEVENAYEKEKYGNLLGKTTLRLYDAFILKNCGDKKLYLVALIEGDFTKNNFTKNSIKLESGYEETTIGGELLPFVHFDLKEKGFIRAGTSISIFYGNYKYTDVWGGEKVILPGWYHLGEDVWWERPSKGNFWKITNFSEINAEILLSRNSTLIFHLWTHLTYTYFLKIFGDTLYSEENGYFFVEEARRNNKLNEFWMGGLIGIRVNKNPELMFVLNLPIQYDNSFYTNIKTTNNVKFVSFSDALPKIRKPIYFTFALSF